jgi:hypothetical protein
MHTIIRIEHISNGDGFFRNSNPELQVNWEEWEELLVRHMSFPTPNRDGGINRGIFPDEYCAFLTIDQVQSLIMPDEFQRLFALGYKAYLMVVSEAKVGEHQCLFRKEDVVSKTDITTIFLNPNK